MLRLYQTFSASEICAGNAENSKVEIQLSKNNLCGKLMGWVIDEYLETLFKENPDGFSWKLTMKMDIFHRSFLRHLYRVAELRVIVFAFVGLKEELKRQNPAELKNSIANFQREKTFE